MIQVAIIASAYAITALISTKLNSLITKLNFNWSPPPSNPHTIVEKPRNPRLFQYILLEVAGHSKNVLHLRAATFQ